jgi:aryl-alcohol dehydrogenase-like predicted oxidoreductase
MRAWQFEKLLTRANNWTLVAELRGYAEQRGHQLTDLAIAWLNASHGVASVLAGATTPDQVRANVAASAAWTLTAEEKRDVDAITAQRTSEEAVRMPTVPSSSGDSE